MKIEIQLWKNTHKGVCKSCGKERRVNSKDICFHYIGFELNPDYVKMAKERLNGIPARLEGFT